MDIPNPSTKDDRSTEQLRSLKLPSLPSRVRVLPPGPVGSEFDPGRDCSLNPSEHQPSFDELNLLALPHWQPPASPVKRTSKNVLWNWKPREGYMFPETNDDALQIIPELASPPARPPRGLPRPIPGKNTVAFRPQRPPPIVGDHLFSSLNFPTQTDVAFSLPMERSNLTLLHESSIYEPSSSGAAMKSLSKNQDTSTELNEVSLSTYEKQDTEANCLCCCFTTFCLVMSIILLTASAVLAIIHGAEVYRRKIATLDPDTFFYTLPGTITESASSSRPASVALTCEPYIIEPCVPFLKYNHTGFPNLVGHNNSRDLDRDLSLFREVMDGECYPLASNLLCGLLQPQCNPTTKLKIHSPCRSFCEYFLHKCDSSIPEKIRPRINCYRLRTEDCIERPACSEELRAIKEDQRICDGNIDCEDRTDEIDCPTEPPSINSTTSE
ncbi:uncharacterized protein LOC108865259 [Galendromus occidentalis]|uniref:Uncharacterized protein LOC108865259 n=1 Tax=Galendromus occidentalis TaxID=34638 RepID=A0AAJ7L6U7_9ACAR|nr:uncharacterized protein LOC108865259 [Galendromus occidentalis]